MWVATMQNRRCSKRVRTSGNSGKTIHGASNFFGIKIDGKGNETDRQLAQWNADFENLKGKKMSVRQDELFIFETNQ